MENANVYTYVKDNLGVYQFVSPNILEFFNMNANNILGLSDFDLPEKNENVLAWIEEDKRILSTGKAEYVINALSINGVNRWQRTYKSPLYNRHGKIQGISGASVFISQESLIPITKQQTACLRLLALGSTYKKIGHELGLSAKTVEHYLEAVKMKLNCNSREELIMQAIERGLIGVFQ
jgi:DNA-binding CsgD family transcriptional regulator